LTFYRQWNCAWVKKWELFWILERLFIDNESEKIFIFTHKIYSNFSSFLSSPLEAFFSLAKFMKCENKKISHGLNLRTLRYQRERSDKNYFRPNLNDPIFIQASEMRNVIQILVKELSYHIEECRVREGSIKICIIPLL
jgi:hypothetical protein